MVCDGLCVWSSDLPKMWGVDDLPQTTTTIPAGKEGERWVCFDVCPEMPPIVRGMKRKTLAKFRQQRATSSKQPKNGNCHSERTVANLWNCRGLFRPANDDNSCAGSRCAVMFMEAKRERGMPRPRAGKRRTECDDGRWRGTDFLRRQFSTSKMKQSAGYRRKGDTS
ncbi:unnamed protein product [Nesidiocoris tenuis]|uniref:Uncharacterized protein n=1 Tax=Nesidiocoris tenuis TaxID=355587 RepID=A0A6H5HI29_9HEMI|nr:unnamed protein product [Nesidiocoris tenuis]